jgi:hypothetical protein
LQKNAAEPCWEKSHKRETKFLPLSPSSFFLAKNYISVMLHDLFTVRSWFVWI